MHLVMLAFSVWWHIRRSGNRRDVQGVTQWTHSSLFWNFVCVYNPLSEHYRTLRTTIPWSCTANLVTAALNRQPYAPTQKCRMHMIVNVWINRSRHHRRYTFVQHSRMLTQIPGTLRNEYFAWLSWLYSNTHVKDTWLFHVQYHTAADVSWMYHLMSHYHIRSCPRLQVFVLLSLRLSFVLTLCLLHIAHDLTLWYTHYLCYSYDFYRPYDLLYQFVTSLFIPHAQHITVLFMCVKCYRLCICIEFLYLCMSIVYDC